MNFLSIASKAAARLFRGNQQPANKLPLGGKFHVEHFNKAGEKIGDYDFPNGITDEGLNHILDTQFGGTTAVSPWYVGLINDSGFSALAAADVMNSHAGWAETDAYTEGNRVEWTEGTAAARSITNAATMDFSINATVTINGIFVTSDNTKLGTTGVLWATASFSSAVSATNGDTLKVTYTVSG